MFLSTSWYAAKHFPAGLFAEWCLVVLSPSAGRNSCHFLYQTFRFGDYRVHRIRVDQGQERRPARWSSRLHRRPCVLVHRRRIRQHLRDGE